MDAPSGQSTSVDYRITRGTAAPGSDYLDAGLLAAALTGTLHFAPGETSRNVDVGALGDTLVEGDETFFLELSNPRGGEILRAQGRATIIDDDFLRLPDPGETPPDGSFVGPSSPAGPDNSARLLPQNSSAAHTGQSYFQPTSQPAGPTGPTQQAAGRSIESSANTNLQPSSVSQGQHQSQAQNLTAVQAGTMMLKQRSNQVATANARPGPKPQAVLASDLSASWARSGPLAVASFLMLAFGLVMKAAPRANRPAVVRSGARRQPERRLQRQRARRR